MREGGRDGAGGEEREREEFGMGECQQTATLQSKDVSQDTNRPIRTEEGSKSKHAEADMKEVKQKIETGIVA